MAPPASASKRKLSKPAGKEPASSSSKKEVEAEESTRTKRIKPTTTPAPAPAEEEEEEEETAPPARSAPPRLTVVVGCYDGSVHGWRGDPTSGKLSLIFAFRAHESCVKSMCLSDKATRLITGGADEAVQLYDTSKLRVLDRLVGPHRNGVSCATFVGSPHYFMTGDEDGRILVWKDRTVLHELKGHKQSPVTSIAIHPSNKAALTTARDNAVRLWDLVQVKPAPRKRLDDLTTLSCACWAPDGSRYAVVGNESTVLIFDADSEDERPLGLVPHPKRVNALCFVEDVMLVSAADDGIVRVFGVDGTPVRSFDLNADRKRLEAEAEGSLPPLRTAVRAREVRAVNDGEDIFIVVVGSDRVVRVWDMNDDEDEPATRLHVGSEAHATCMTAALG